MATKKKEKVTITKDDVGEVDPGEISDRLDEIEDDAKTEGGPDEKDSGGSGLAMESADVAISESVEDKLRHYHSVVMGFASYLGQVQTFKVGTRGNLSKLARHAADFCAENDFTEPDDEFLGTLKFPEEK
jgi:hypothetical protein